MDIILAYVGYAVFYAIIGVVVGLIIVKMFR